MLPSNGLLGKEIWREDSVPLSIAYLPICPDWGIWLIFESRQKCVSIIIASLFVNEFEKAIAAAWTASDHFQSMCCQQALSSQTSIPCEVLILTAFFVWHKALLHTPYTM